MATGTPIGSKRIKAPEATARSPDRKKPRRAAAAAACRNLLDYAAESATANEADEDHLLLPAAVPISLAHDETEALMLTAEEAGMQQPQNATPPTRKLIEFSLSDAEGNPQPIEMSEHCDIFASGIIASVPGPKDRGTSRGNGVRLEKFGPVTSWRVTGFQGGSVGISVVTADAEYGCSKPTRPYKRFFDILLQKAIVAVAIYGKLVACERQKATEPSLNELIASVVRTLVNGKDFPSGLYVMDFIKSQGEFIFNELAALGHTSNGVLLSTFPVLLALRAETRLEASCAFHTRVATGGMLQIKDGIGAATNDMKKDEELAKLLQEEEKHRFLKKQASLSKRNTGGKASTYIRINEDEIAGDYPLPAYYKPSVQEIDEYILFDSGSYDNQDGLRRQVLTNWSLYNSDSRLVPLELLAMKPGADDDVMIFGSGYTKEEDDSWGCTDQNEGTIAGGSGGQQCGIDDGFPVYLSAIKEWVIEFGADVISVSIRTDLAWYRLEKPSKQYTPWFEPVLKIARLARYVISLLMEQTRVSIFSFSDVIKRLIQLEAHHPAYVSSVLAVVECYVTVHGQIILQQFNAYPDTRIRKSAFATGLLKKMEERGHTKLALKKLMPGRKSGSNLNPSATICAAGLSESKRKAMRATTTKLVNKIWRDYYGKYFPASEMDGLEIKQEADGEEEEQTEEDDSEDADISIQEEQDILSPSNTKSVKQITPSNTRIRWIGEAIAKTSSGDMVYHSAEVGESVNLQPGSIIVAYGKGQKQGRMLYIEYLYESTVGDKMAHGRLLKKGVETVLGNAANDNELFLTHDCVEAELSDAKETVIVDFLRFKWGYEHRKPMSEAIASVKHYYCKSLYSPEKGAFFCVPLDSMGLGNGTCSSCKARKELSEGSFEVASDSFKYKRVRYEVDDYVYIKPDHFNSFLENGRGTFKAGRNVGLQAYVVCRLIEVLDPGKSRRATPDSTLVKVRRFYRPEELSIDKAYCSDIREIYYSEDILDVPLSIVEGRCYVCQRAYLQTSKLPVLFDHMFFCDYSYDPRTGSLNMLKYATKHQLITKKAMDEDTVRKSKGKSKCHEVNGMSCESDKANGDTEEVRLRTLDIFAGCGGLSEGLTQSGVSLTKWAIEFEQPAAEAFSQNHQEAFVFIDNCNVILRAIMEKFGDVEDCISTTEAADLASKLDEKKLENLPLPGQVDFINGGPPCQGFSGMNRFNQGTWSKVQCEMVLAFLSFAEYFRPRFFLLENVRNFISFNKGQTFRLTLASLLEMNYQVRFGILEAGAYGVSQSRKRAFIWAASPEETLPDWPQPMHVFAGPDLKISLPGNVQYAAVGSTMGGAPFRPITVRDTIGDLPSVRNGASEAMIEYDSNPTSWFQRKIRGGMLSLHDHISKEMNELNLTRCKLIPKRPGADWRDLPVEKVTLLTGQRVDLVPWCLPNTAKRHNQWKGLYGRLDWEGNFPTSVTDPQPMGKVGMCFHPEQDRIVTVRECARSQGFPDSYRFFGNIQSKHKQIGNAVPPPLAYALGRKLKEVVDAKIRGQHLA